MAVAQLYAQAMCLRPILKAKVYAPTRTRVGAAYQGDVSYAAGSPTGIPHGAARCPGMYMKWEDVTRGVVRETKVLWTSLKVLAYAMPGTDTACGTTNGLRDARVSHYQDEDRSIEKALQCYEGDLALSTCYVMSGTDTAGGGICLRARYAISGTD
eukprot:102895-Rhodomonas_salina.2